MKMMETASARRPRRARRGYLYVAVLFTTLMIVAVVTASLTVSTANSRAETDRGNSASAIRLAESEIHRLAAIMQSDDNWRVTEVNGMYSGWIDSTSIGLTHSDAGQVRHQFADPDNNLSDDYRDSVTLTAHARVGRSNVGVSVDMTPRFDPLDLLRYGVTATDDIQFENGGTLSVENNVQVSDDCKTTTSGTLITPQLECSGNVEMTLRGDLSNDNISMPSIDVVDYYFQLGTVIPIASLPIQSGDLVIENRLISVGENPFGVASPSGVYRIDAQGQDIRISNCRINATLVIHDAPQITITGGVNWSYPLTTDAVLVTDGDVTWENIEPTLRESAAAINFNPSSTPYRNSSNGNTSDTYPSEIYGVLYSTNDFVFRPLTDNSRLQITGAIMCRDLEIRAHVSVLQLDELLTNTPVAFANWVPMEFVHGTFRRVPLP